ncbi:class I SAM-dependent methyltransferase [Sporichthya polymorpha]|uniref:class I SAM-dependent methyltransferase n=1 Tax=Sporichthya polymorpha TaxID=35751 RepID=UPI0003629589|nr:class I SAM-dependent methyltransferase [Sporichthya polymorpha]
MALTSAVPDRVRLALDLLDLGCSERVMEVGCGPGVAAAEVCARLTTGSLVATDRSAAAIARTSRRNAAAIAAGRMSVRQVALADLDLPAASVDVAFAIDVNLFWIRDPAPELAVLRRVLRPDGRLVLVFGHGPQDPERLLPILTDRLAAGFADVIAHRSPLGFGATARRVS